MRGASKARACCTQLQADPAATGADKRMNTSTACPWWSWTLGHLVSGDLEDLVRRAIRRRMDAVTAGHSRFDWDELIFPLPKE